MEFKLVRVISHLFHENYDIPLYSSKCIEISDENSTYLNKIFKSAVGSSDKTKSKLEDDEYFYSLVESFSDDVKFIEISRIISEKLYELESDKRTSSQLFISAVVHGDLPYLVCIKQKIKESVVTLIESSESERIIDIQKNMMALPDIKSKVSQFFMINLRSGDVSIGKDKVFSNCIREIYKLKTNLTPSESYKAVRDSAIEIISEKYNSDLGKVSQTINLINEEIQETNHIDIDEVAFFVFKDNEEAKKEFKEKIIQKGVAEAKIEADKSVARKVVQKQKILTDNGIEILIPIEFLNDPNVIKIETDGKGELNILLKGFNHIK